MSMGRYSESVGDSLRKKILKSVFYIFTVAVFTTYLVGYVLDWLTVRDVMFIDLTTNIILVAFGWIVVTLILYCMKHRNKP